MSGRSPFPNCRIQTPGIRFLNSAVEPFIDANPKTVNNTGKENLLSVWQADRFSNGGTSGLVAGASFNGGRTWKITGLPFSECVRGGVPFPRASDPWVSFGPNRKAYISGISANLANLNTAISVVTTKDGGRTFSRPTVIVQDKGKRAVNDKPSVTADPIQSNVAYVVWTRTQFISGGNYRNAARLAKTTDGGRTFRSRNIFNAGINNNTIGSIIVPNPKTGVLYHFFVFVKFNGNKSTHFNLLQTSRDRGETWSKARTISKVTLPLTFEIDSGGNVDSSFTFLGIPFRTGSALAVSAAINKKNGDLYVVWEDARFSNRKVPEVAISVSRDGGRTWSKPRRVNRPLLTPAFTPTVSVNDQGQVGVTYSQSLKRKSINTLPTQYKIKFSFDGGRSFSSKETNLGKRFDYLNAPYSEPGYFTGDYQGLTTLKNTFVPFFSKANPTNVRAKASTFVAKVKPKK